MKLKTLSEAKYSGAERGSIQWLIQTFMEEWPNDNWRFFKVKHDMKIRMTLRGTRIDGVEVYPNDDYMFTGLDGKDVNGSVDQIKVEQVKQVWSGPKANER